MQGEQDSKHQVSAESYASSLALLKKRVQEDFCKGQMIPMAFGQVLPYSPAMERFVARDVIRKQMSYADANSGHQAAIPMCYMVSTDEMPISKDTVHYNSQGQFKLGKEMAVKIMEHDK